MLSEAERMVIKQTGELWNAIQSVVPEGPVGDGDLRELIVHIHAIQRAIMANAAARAYPEEFRLLGSTLASIREQTEHLREILKNDSYYNPPTKEKNER